MDGSIAMVLGLLVVPFAAALIAAILGPARGNAIRWLSLSTTLIGLVLAITVTVRFQAIRAEQPMPKEA